MIPVMPSFVNIKINSIVHIIIIGDVFILLPFIIKIHLRILILVWIAIIIVANIKYITCNWVSMSNSTVYIFCELHFFQR